MCRYYYIRCFSHIGSIDSLEYQYIADISPIKLPSRGKIPRQACYYSSADYREICLTTTRLY